MDSRNPDVYRNPEYLIFENFPLNPPKTAALMFPFGKKCEFNG